LQATPVRVRLADGAESGLANIVQQYLEQSLALATPLVPFIGYDRAASLAKKAFETKKTIREVALEERIMPEDEVRRILDETVAHAKKGNPEGERSGNP